MDIQHIFILISIIILILFLLNYNNQKKENIGKKIYIVNNKKYINAKKKDLRVDINDKLEDRFDDQGKHAF